MFIELVLVLQFCGSTSNVLLTWYPPPPQMLVLQDAIHVHWSKSLNSYKYVIKNKQAEQKTKETAA
jgi:hypothetical protein